MTGLDPVIHAVPFTPVLPVGVDARIKSGHDEE
jgi:hypothetical protein